MSSSTNNENHPHPHNKPCTLCHTPRPVLVRCQIDDSGTWHMVCPGNCWKSVSGGMEDARGREEEFPWYRYGGMWKVCFFFSFFLFFWRDGDGGMFWFRNGME